MQKNAAANKEMLLYVNRITDSSIFHYIIFS